MAVHILVALHNVKLAEGRVDPLGVKGAGEAGCVGAMPAVGNALMDALTPYGVKDNARPATPERIWRALKTAKAG